MVQAASILNPTRRYAGGAGDVAKRPVNATQEKYVTWLGQAGRATDTMDLCMEGYSRRGCSLVTPGDPNLLLRPTSAPSFILQQRLSVPRYFAFLPQAHPGASFALDFWESADYSALRITDIFCGTGKGCMIDMVACSASPLDAKECPLQCSAFFGTSADIVLQEGPMAASFCAQCSDKTDPKRRQLMAFARGHAKYWVLKPHFVGAAKGGGAFVAGKPVKLEVHT